MLLLTDRDVAAELSPALAVDAARRALIDSYTGRLAAPARLEANFGEGSLVFTAGGYEKGPVGFRVYGLWRGGDQAVLVWNDIGELRGVIVGSELGIRRTGALGAVAIDALANRDATQVGIIGSGPQAWAQLWATTATRTISQVLVFSATREHRNRFASRVESELGIAAEAVDSPETATRRADILILATRSLSPVIEASWVSEGTHINTVGPKTLSGHETPPALADLATMVVSDAPQQASAYEEPFFTSRPLTHLGQVLYEGRGRASDRDITLYCSTGLAGSEVVIAADILGLAER